MTRPHDEMTLFQRAIERPEAEREAFVRAQSDDPALVERVLELLRDREAAGEGFLEEVVSGAAASFSPAPIPTALGQFELLHPIGHGGMGIVYEARDLRLGRKVAVKLLAAHLTASELNRARFRNEAKIVAGLSHPGIVPVYSYDEADGHMYIVCELIGGESLGTLLEREKQAGSHEERALSDARIAQIVAAVAEALGYAHGMGVIHRDVKPANILLTPDGSPRLTDFGIAKLLTDDAGVTSPGAGTVQYMSPEQIDALDATVDHRTDIFSLGVVLYEMLTGRLPFRGESREQIVGSLRTSEPTAPQKLVKGIPRDLQTICLKALEKRPRDRYQSAAHFAADLHSFLAGAPILARPRSPIEHALRRFYTRRRAIGVGLAVVGAAAGGYGWNNWLRDTRARVRLTGVGDDAQLAVQIFDPESQRFVAHDNVTLTHGINRLPAGHYRFVVRDSSGYAEISRTLQDGDDIELSPRILPTRSVTESMALIPSGSDSGFRAAISGEDAYFSLARQLPAFWIDRTEVSNAEYRRFVDATGHEPPPWWNDE